MPATPCAETTTHIVNKAFSLALPGRALFSIADAADLRIACAQGSIWITLDHDARDIVLGDCQVFSTTEHRKAVIYAFQPSRVTISSTKPMPMAQSQRQPGMGLVLHMQPA